MKVVNTPIYDLKIVEPNVYSDSRGGSQKHTMRTLLCKWLEIFFCTR